jgi:hypothetical protein
MDPFDAYFSPQAKPAAPVAKDAFDSYFGAPAKAEAIKTEVKAATPRQGMTEALAQPAGSGFDDAMAGASFRTADDIVRALASGASFGLIDKGAAAANALLGRGDYASNVREELGRSRQFEEENPAVSLPAQLIGSLASGALLGGPLMAMRGPTVAKTIIGGGGAGAAGAFGGAEGTPEEQASETGSGALAGAALGAALPVVGNVALRGAQAVGRGVDPGIQALARRAEELGIPLSGAQISGSPAMKYLESTLNKMPGVYKGAPGQQREAFTQAVSRTIGEDTPKITTEVMASAKTRIGKMFDDVASMTKIKADDDLINGLKRIEDEAAQVLTAGEMTPIKTQLGNILGKVEDGVIDGKTYQALTRKGAPLDRASSSSDPNVRFYAGQIRGALDDALERSAAPETLEVLRTARTQYKNLKTIEDLAEKADASGQISPALLLSKVRQSYGDYAYRGGGELGDLAKIGQQFLKEPPSSGTAERLFTGAGLLGGGASVMNPSLMAPAIGGAAGAVGAGNLARMAINSDVYRNALMGKYGPALTQELNQRMIQAGVLGGGLLGQSRGQ